LGVNIFVGGVSAAEAWTPIEPSGLEFLHRRRYDATYFWQPAAETDPVPKSALAEYVALDGKRIIYWGDTCHDASEF